MASDPNNPFLSAEFRRGGGGGRATPAPTRRRRRPEEEDEDKLFDPITAEEFGEQIRRAPSDLFKVGRGVVAGAADTLVGQPLHFGAYVGSRINRAMGMDPEEADQVLRAVREGREDIREAVMGEGAGAAGTLGYVGGSLVGGAKMYGSAGEKLAAAAPRLAARARAAGASRGLASTIRGVGSENAGFWATRAREAAAGAPLTAMFEAPEKEASTAEMVAGLEGGQAWNDPIARAAARAAETTAGRVAFGVGADILADVGVSRLLEGRPRGAGSRRRPGVTRAELEGEALPRAVEPEAASVPEEAPVPTPTPSSRREEPLDRIAAERAQAEAELARLEEGAMTPAEKKKRKAYLAQLDKLQAEEKLVSQRARVAELADREENMFQAALAGAPRTNLLTDAPYQYGPNLVDMPGGPAALDERPIGFETNEFAMPPEPPAEAIDPNLIDLPARRPGRVRMPRERGPRGAPEGFERTAPAATDPFLDVVEARHRGAEPRGESPEATARLEAAAVEAPPASDMEWMDRLAARPEPVDPLLVAVQGRGEEPLIQPATVVGRQAGRGTAAEDLAEIERSIFSPYPDPAGMDDAQLAARIEDTAAELRAVRGDPIQTTELQDRLRLLQGEMSRRVQEAPRSPWSWRQAQDRIGRVPEDLAERTAALPGEDEAARIARLEEGASDWAARELERMGDEEPVAAAARTYTSPEAEASMARAAETDDIIANALRGAEPERGGVSLEFASEPQNGRRVVSLTAPGPGGERVEIEGTYRDDGSLEISSIVSDATGTEAFRPGTSWTRRMGREVMRVMEEGGMPVSRIEGDRVTGMRSGLGQEDPRVRLSRSAKRLGGAEPQPEPVRAAEEILEPTAAAVEVETPPERAAQATARITTTVTPEEIPDDLVELYRKVEAADAKYSEARQHERSRSTAGLSSAKTRVLRKFTEAARKAGFDMDDMQTGADVMRAAAARVDPDRWASTEWVKRGEAAAAPAAAVEPKPDAFPGINRDDPTAVQVAQEEDYERIYNQTYDEIEASTPAPKLKWKRQPDGVHVAEVEGGRWEISNEGDRADPDWTVTDPEGVTAYSGIDTVSEAREIASDLAREAQVRRLTEQRMTPAEEVLPADVPVAETVDDAVAGLQEVAARFRGMGSSQERDAAARPLATIFARHVNLEDRELRDLLDSYAEYDRQAASGVTEIDGGDIEDWLDNARSNIADRALKISGVRGLDYYTAAEVGNALIERAGRLTRAVADPYAVGLSPEMLANARLGDRASVGFEEFQRTKNGWRKVSKKGTGVTGKTISMEEMMLRQQASADPVYAEHRARAQAITDPSVLVERTRSIIRRAAAGSGDQKILQKEAMAFRDELESRGLSTLGAAEVQVLSAIARTGLGAVVGGMAGGEEGAISGALVGLGLPAIARGTKALAQNLVESGKLYANPFGDPALYRRPTPKNAGSTLTAEQQAALGIVHTADLPRPEKEIRNRLSSSLQERGWKPGADFWVNSKGHRVPVEKLDTPALERLTQAVEAEHQRRVVEGVPHQPGVAIIPPDAPRPDFIRTSPGALVAMALRGIEGKEWYTQGRKGLQILVESGQVKAEDYDRFLRYLATFSPNTGPLDNLREALRHYRAWERGGTPFGVLSAKQSKARLVQRGAQIDSNKVWSFAENLVGDERWATVDIWAMRAIGSDPKFTGIDPDDPAVYAYVQREYQELASQLEKVTGENWTAAEAQAAAWVAARVEVDEVAQRIAKEAGAKKPSKEHIQQAIDELVGSPEQPGWWEQMGSAVRRTATDSQSPGEAWARLQETPPEGWRQHPSSINDDYGQLLRAEMEAGRFVDPEGRPLLVTAEEGQTRVTVEGMPGRKPESRLPGRENRPVTAAMMSADFDLRKRYSEERVKVFERTVLRDLFKRLGIDTTPLTPAANSWNSAAGAVRSGGGLGTWEGNLNHNQPIEIPATLADGTPTPDWVKDVVTAVSGRGTEQDAVPWMTWRVNDPATIEPVMDLKGDWDDVMAEVQRSGVQGSMGGVHMVSAIGNFSDEMIRQAKDGLANWLKTTDQVDNQLRAHLLNADGTLKFDLSVKGDRLLFGHYDFNYSLRELHDVVALGLRNVEVSVKRPDGKVTGPFIGRFVDPESVEVSRFDSKLMEVGPGETWNDHLAAAIESSGRTPSEVLGGQELEDYLRKHDDRLRSEYDRIDEKFASELRARQTRKRGKRAGKTATGVALAAALTNPVALQAQVGAAVGAAAGEDEEGGRLGSALLGAAALATGAVGVRALTSGAAGRGARAVLNGIGFVKADDAVKAVEGFMRRNMTSMGDLPPDVFRSKIRNNGWINSQVREVSYTIRDFEKAAEKAFGGVDRMTDADVLLIDDALKGQVPLSSLPQEMVPVVTKMRTHIDALSRRMIQDGVVQGPLAATINANLGVYARRTYRIFDDPSWPKNIPEPTKNRAIAYLRQEYPTATQEEIDGLMGELLGRGDESPLALMSKGKLGSKALKTLTSRKDIHPSIRALWGEYGEAHINYAKSVANMSRLIGAHNILLDAKQTGMGVWLHDRPIVRDGVEFTKLIAADGSKAMAPLNGLYTSPEIVRAFESFDAKETNAFLRMYMKVNGTVKVGKTVFSPQSQVRNLIGNLGFAIANGHARAGEMNQAFRTIVNDLGGTNYQAFRDRYKRYQELGVVGTSTTEGEIRDIVKDASKQGVAYLTNPMTTRLGKAINATTEVYRASDDLWKIYAFENEVARYRKAMPNLPREQVEEMAAEIVRNTYPNYDMVPEAIKALRRIPLVGTFTSFPAEVVRTGYHTLSQAAKEMADPATRAIGLQRAAGILAAATVTGAAAITSRQLVGVQRDEEEDMRRFMAPWDKYAQFFHLGKDGRGNRRFINMGYTDPYSYLKEPALLLLNGGDWEGKLTEVGWMLAEPFLGEEILAERLVDVARNTTRDGKEIYNPQADPVTKFADSLLHVAEALEPGFVTQAQRIARGVTGEQTQSGRVYNPKDELLSVATGQRRQAVDIRQGLGYKARDFQEGLQNAQRIINRTLTDRSNLDEKDIQQAYADTELSRRRLFEEMHEDAMAAIRMGVPRNEVAALLAQGGLSRDMVGRVMNGVYVPYMPSKQFQKVMGRSLSSTATSMEERRQRRDTARDRLRTLGESRRLLLQETR